MMRFAVLTLAGVLVAMTAPGLPPSAPAAALGAPPPGRIVRVPASANLQAVLDAAQPGDFIELPAGVTFVGNFILPKKPGKAWIVIYSSAFWSLPPPGTPLVPAVHAGLMPKIVSENGDPAIRTAAGAHHYVFAGIEVTVTPTNPSLLNLIYLDFTGQTIEQIPTDIILYRCYIHGNSDGEIRRGVALNGARLAVIGSYLSDFHTSDVDSHAIQGWNGPGPFRIVGNYLEGAGVNVMFGGEDPTIENLVPSDIEIRGNHFFKPLSWRVGDPAYVPPPSGIPWSVKNLFELKNARRVTVEGNIFENNWTQANQGGFAIVLTPRNQSNTASWSVVEDVTITNNIIRHSTAGISFLGRDNINVSQQLKGVLISNNLFEHIGEFADTVFGGVFTGMLFLVSGGRADLLELRGPANLRIDHNTHYTTFQIGFPIYAQVHPGIPWQATGFAFTNNIVLNDGGVLGDGTETPSATLSTYFPEAVFARNALVAATAASYPVDNFFPISPVLVGFVNLTGGDYRLSLTSPYKNAGTDGKDLGADFDALQAALLRWW